MPPDEEEAQPDFAGPVVVIRPVDGIAWTVGIECQPRTYGSKHEAFGAARALWSDHRLPCRDMTVAETARAFDHEK